MPRDGKRTQPDMLLCDESASPDATRLDAVQPSSLQPAPIHHTGAPSAEVRDAMLAAMPSLRAFALSLTRNPEYADDLVQDTILRAWKNLEQFEVGTNINAWLFTILRNGFRSQWRRARREVEDPDEVYAGRLWTPPEQAGKCDVQDMFGALAKLSVDQREALLLIVAEGLSYEDAAQVCGVAIGTIKSRVNRARQCLARLLAVETAEDLGPDRVLQAALQHAL